MVSTNEYVQTLEKAYQLAEELIRSQTGQLESYIQQPLFSHPLKTIRDGQIVSWNRNIVEGIQTIISNLKQNKYLYSILVTSLLEKIVHPEQDIRIAQTTLENGFSNRSTDQIYVTPFLKKHSLTHCAASGLESGRNFERPYPYLLSFPANPKGKGNREAFLGILHAVEEEQIDPFPIIVLIIALDLERKSEASYTYLESKGLTIQQIITALLDHFNKSRGNGRARLPVLAIHAIYQSLVEELARYSNKELLAPNRHTANDKEGKIGDIQVNNLDGTPFEGVEVKSGKSVEIGMILTLPRKFQGFTVNRYYILSTEENYIREEELEDVENAIRAVSIETGCEIIVNGLIRTLWYYLRLIINKDDFFVHYTELIKNDPDVQDEHREIWSEILFSLDI